MQKAFRTVKLNYTPKCAQERRTDEKYSYRPQANFLHPVPDYGLIQPMHQHHRSRRPWMIKKGHFSPPFSNNKDLLRLVKGAYRPRYVMKACYCLCWMLRPNTWSFTLSRRRKEVQDEEKEIKEKGETRKQGEEDRELTKKETKKRKDSLALIICIPLIQGCAHHICSMDPTAASGAVKTRLKLFALSVPDVNNSTLLRRTE